MKQMFITDDGKYFNTAKEAESYEAMLKEAELEKERIRKEKEKEKEEKAKTKAKREEEIKNLSKLLHDKVYSFYNDYHTIPINNSGLFFYGDVDNKDDNFLNQIFKDFDMFRM